MPAHDRDLLLLEPNLFRDIQPASQTLLIGTCDVDEYTATLTESSASFTTAAIAPGFVALIDAIPYEVIAVTSPITITISRLRKDVTQTILLLPAQKTGLPIAIVSFAPQLAAAHDALLRAAGIEPDGPHLPGTPLESQITNPAALTPLICLHALAAIHFSAAAGLPPDSPPAHRATLLQRKLEYESERASLSLDLNNDSLPDALRPLRGGPLLRA